ncbi:CBS domain-containing protein [Streptomyces sp. NBC_00365]|uniref:CBS domain-containing protein n=1 Tax=Streptomyces sp. NBC_00365 TaxID=2975726 RepID=UPI002B1E5D17|nr:CBS domain-containing protein [Streptomyces sp. NBC_00365]
MALAVPGLSPHDTVAHAVERLRLHRASLAVVRDDAGRLTGLVGLDDLPARLLEPRAA